MKETRVEIVTPVHNRRDLTLQFLKSVSNIDRTGLSVHPIVVDDGSTDGTSEAIAQEFPEVEIIKGDGNLWYTAGTNRGIEAALRHNADFVLCVNNDSILDESCVRRMVECAEEHPRSVVGALLLSWNTPHRIFQVSPEWRTRYGGWRHWFKQTVWTIPNKPWTVDIIVGNCVLFPTEAIREVGLMDEKRFSQYGDAEYTPRMRKRGWRLLIEPRARVYCKPNDLPMRLRSMSFRTLFSALFLEPHNPHSLRRRLNMTLYGAPTRLQGLIAFIVFFIRAAFGRSYESAWAQNLEEPPLSETFRDRVIE